MKEEGKKVKLMQDVEEEAKRVVEQIHKYNPKYVFLTETSSVQVGALIKEALRTAYPNQPLPSFYRIDPRQVIPVLKYGQNKVDGNVESSPSFEKEKRDLEEFFKKRIKDRDAKILVYDNDWASGKSPGSIVALLKNPERFGFNKDIQSQEVKMNSKSINYTQWGYGLDPENWGGLNLALTKEDLAPISHYGGFPFGDLKLTDKARPFSKSHREGAGNYNFRGRIRKKHRLSGESYHGWHLSQQDLIRDIKRQGRALGELIHNEIEAKQETKKKGLEGTLGIISIAGFLFSVLFFSGITGNVIGATETKNIIGIISFLVGIVGAFFYFRSRKK